MRPIDGDKLIEEANKDGAYGYVSVKQIADAPTIEQYGTWIPCDDNTPVKEGKYIVTTAKGSVYCTKGGKYGFHTPYDTHIIAYMPLPEPYREEKKDE